MLHAGCRPNLRESIASKLKQRQTIECNNRSVNCKKGFNGKRENANLRE